MCASAVYGRYTVYENLRKEGREGRCEGRIGMGKTKKKKVISHGQATAESICEPGKRS